MKLVSVAVCTYNGEKYLHEQLDSLLKQTYINLEIIVTDDRSTDRTMEILSSYATRDKRVKVFQNEINLGYVKNFSKAISLCTGDLIALADQDDIWKLSKIEKFIAEIGDNTLIYSDAILMDENGKSLNKQLIRPENNLISGHCNKAFLFNNCVSGNTLMFKKELLSYLLPIPDVSMHDIWIAFVASSVGSIGYTDEAMTYYRRHNEQATQILSKKKRYTNFIQKIKQKISTKKELVHNGLRDALAYKTFISKIDDPITHKILNEMIHHYENYDKTYINFPLRQLLKKYIDELFMIMPKKKRLSRAKRSSFGLKYYIYTLFIL